jgi:hypothetical protein
MIRLWLIMSGIHHAPTPGCPAQRVETFYDLVRDIASYELMHCLLPGNKTREAIEQKVKLTADLIKIGEQA